MPSHFRRSLTLLLLTFSLLPAAARAQAKKADYLRGLAVMGEAVSAVNKLNEPDLARASLPITIQGKNFSTFAGWPMPTFTLESSFGELGARDFEATLAQANRLGDKYLRAAAVFALAARCLEDAEAQEKQSRPKRPARGAGKQ